jgi:adenylate cyclase
VFGDILNWSGRPQEAIALVEKALRLDPYNLPWHLFSLGHACYLLGKHEEAITTLKRILESHPNHLGAHVYLAVLYSELGQEAQAQAEGRIVLQLSPEASLEKVQQRFPYQNPADLQRLLDGLRKAGFQ